MISQQACYTVLLNDLCTSITFVAIVPLLLYCHFPNQAQNTTTLTLTPTTYLDSKLAQKRKMERTEKDKKSSAPRLLPPIDASYQPSRAVTKIPATSSLEEIIAVIERDGGVILTDFVSLETLDKIDEELQPYINPTADKDSYDNFIGKKTRVIPGLVGKSDTIANILDTNETIEKLLKVILEERYPAVFEEHTEELVIDPLLSIALGFYVGQGSPRQALHRDDMIFSSKHRPDMKINEVDGFSCFLAGTKVTRENGGTMVILGSHKWEHDRRGRPDEVSFLGKSYIHPYVNSQPAV